MNLQGVRRLPNIYFSAMNPYKPGSYHFGWFLNANDLRWFHCREQFHNNVDIKPFGYYYSMDNHDWIELPKIVEGVEQHLGLRQKTIFRASGIANILWIEPSPFWFKQRMRHSFFSIVIRSAHFSGNTWLEKLMKNKYFMETKIAVNRFLDGFTHYTGNVIGWWKQFTFNYDNAPKPFSEQHIKNFLVRPIDPQEKEDYIRAMSYRLWEKERNQGKDLDYWLEAERNYLLKD